MQPSLTNSRIVSVLAPDGSGVTGLTLAAFTISAWAMGYAGSAFTTWSHGSTLTELGGGDYAWSYTEPPSAGFRFIELKAIDVTRQVVDGRIRGEIENNDLDAVATTVLLAAGNVDAPTNLLLGWSYPGELVAYRYNRWVLPIVDAAGSPVDLSTGYGNLALSVRSKDQSTKKLDATNGSPTGFVLTGGLGSLTIVWPELTGSGLADIYGFLAAGTDRTDGLYYEVTGDISSDTAKTVPIIRSSPLAITRREVGT